MTAEKGLLLEVLTQYIAAAGTASSTFVNRSYFYVINRLLTHSSNLPKRSEFRVMPIE